MRPVSALDPMRSFADSTLNGPASVRCCHRGISIQSFRVKDQTIDVEKNGFRCGKAVDAIYSLSTTPFHSMFILHSRDNGMIAVY